MSSTSSFLSEAKDLFPAEEKRSFASLRKTSGLKSRDAQD